MNVIPLLLLISLLCLADCVPEPGSCEVIAEDSRTGVKTSQCRSTAMSLKPGDNTASMMEIPQAFKEAAYIYRRKVRIVDETGRLVPLDEVYLHHFTPKVQYNPHLLLGAHHSIFNSLEPYKFISKPPKEDQNIGELRLVNMVGVDLKDAKSCLECWCPTSDEWNPAGEVYCCDTARCKTSSKAPAKNYYLEYNMTYKETMFDDQPQRPMRYIPYDIHGGVNYNIPRGGPGAIHVVQNTFPYDYFCPQRQPVALLRCSGHQHPHALGIKVWDVASGELICISLPIYGTEKGAVGNEAGYLVNMTETIKDPPYMLQPGQKIKVQALYDAEFGVGGAMSLLLVTYGDMHVSDECYQRPGSAYFIPPPDKHKPTVKTVWAKSTTETSRSKGFVAPSSDKNTHFMMPGVFMLFAVSVVLGVVFYKKPPSHWMHKNEHRGGFHDDL